MQYSITFFVDVNTSQPDKKSIIMYVMCFFQVLQSEDSQDDALTKEETSSIDLDDVRKF